MENVMKFLTPKSQIAYIDDKSSVRQALEKMRFHGYNALPVIDEEGRYVGTLTEGDFLWHLIATNSSNLRDQEEESVCKLIRPSWNPPVQADTTMTELLEKVKERNFAPVVDGRGCFVGIVTRKAVLSYFSRLYSSDSIPAL